MKLRGVRMRNNGGNETEAAKITCAGDEESTKREDTRSVTKEDTKKRMTKEE